MSIGEMLSRRLAGLGGKGRDGVPGERDTDLKMITLGC